MNSLIYVWKHPNLRNNPIQVKEDIRKPVEIESSNQITKKLLDEANDIQNELYRFKIKSREIQARIQCDIDIMKDSSISSKHVTTNLYGALIGQYKCLITALSDAKVLIKQIKQYSNQSATDAVTKKYIELLKNTIVNLKHLNFRLKWTGNIAVSDLANIKLLQKSMASFLSENTNTLILPLNPQWTAVTPASPLSKLLYVMNDIVARLLPKTESASLDQTSCKPAPDCSKKPLPTPAHNTKPVADNVSQAEKNNTGVNEKTNIIKRNEAKATEPKTGSAPADNDTTLISDSPLTELLDKMNNMVIKLSPSSNSSPTPLRTQSARSNAGQDKSNQVRHNKTKTKPIFVFGADLKTKHENMNEVKVNELMKEAYIFQIQLNNFKFISKEIATRIQRDIDSVNKAIDYDMFSKENVHLASAIDCFKTALTRLKNLNITCQSQKLSKHNVTDSTANVRENKLQIEKVLFESKWLGLLVRSHINSKNLLVKTMAQAIMSNRRENMFVQYYLESIRSDKADKHKQEHKNSSTSKAQSSPSDDVKPTSEKVDDKQNETMKPSTSKAQSSPSDDAKPTSEKVDNQQNETTSPSDDDKPTSEKVDNQHNETTSPSDDDKPTSEKVDNQHKETTSPSDDDKPASEKVDNRHNETTSPSDDDKPTSEKVDNQQNETTSPSDDDKPTSEKVDNQQNETTSPSDDDKPAFEKVDNRHNETTSPSDADKPTSEKVDNQQNETTSPSDDDKPASEKVDNRHNETTSPSDDDKPTSEKVDNHQNETTSPSDDDKPTSEKVDNQQNETTSPSDDDKPTSEKVDNQHNETTSPSDDDKPTSEKMDEQTPEKVAAQKYVSGQQLYEFEKYKEAFLMFHEASELCPWSSIYLSKTARAALKLGDCMQALENAKKAVALDSTNKLGYKVIAQCYLNMGEVTLVSQTLDSYKEMFGVRMQYEWSMLFELQQKQEEARTLMDREKYYDALDLINDCLEHYCPTCYKTKLMKAECLAFIKRFAEAQEIASSIKVFLDEYSVNGAYYILGYCSYYKCKYEEALNWFKKIGETNRYYKKVKQFIDVANQKLLIQVNKEAKIAFDCGRFEKALQLYNKGLDYVKDKDEEAVIYYNIGTAYAKLKRTREAEQACTIALDLKQDYMKALERRALFCTDLGEYEDAVEDYKKLIELHRQANIMDSNIKRLLRKAVKVQEKFKRVNYYYKLLGIENTASVKEIVQAYRAKLRIYHPDKHWVKNPAVVARETRRTQRIVEAKFLEDKQLRAEYDRKQNYYQHDGSDDSDDNSNQDDFGSFPRLRPIKLLKPFNFNF